MSVASQNALGNARSPLHDDNGRFKVGNPGGPGNPYVKRQNALKAALFAAVKPDDIREIAAKLIEKAKRGDVRAARELLDRVLGKPAQAVAVTGADGEPLGVTLAAVQVAVLGALDAHPEAKFAVAARLRELAVEPARSDGGGA